MKNVIIFAYLILSLAHANEVYFQKHQKVKYVIDGDTIVVKKGKKQEKVRLAGIQTSEITESSPEVFAIEAKNFVQKKLKNKYVTLEILQSTPRDKYGRILANVYIEPHNIWLQGLLLEKGLAFAYIFPDYNFKIKELYQKEQEAMEQKLNMWNSKEFKVINAKEANANLHKYKIIKDKVFSIQHRKNFVLLSMGKRQNPLTVFIKNEEVAKLHFPIDKLQNKTVQVRGFPYYKNGQTKMFLQKHFFIQI